MNSLVHWARMEPASQCRDLIENCQPLAETTYLNNQKATMSHWRYTTVDRPETDGAVYGMGWTISGLAVIGTIVAVWILDI